MSENAPKYAKGDKLAKGSATKGATATKIALTNEMNYIKDGVLSKLVNKRLIQAQHGGGDATSLPDRTASNLFVKSVKHMSMDGN